MRCFLKKSIALFLFIIFVFSAFSPITPIAKAQEESDSFNANSLGLVLTTLVLGDVTVSIFCAGYAETADTFKAIYNAAKERLLSWGWEKGKDIAGDFVEGIISPEVPVRAKEVEKQEKQTRKEQIAAGCNNFLSKVLLAQIKKRLLDSLVDETIRWIQGGGNPRFITNSNQFLNDAIQSAAGDTAYALGLSNLCTQPLKFRLKLNLIQPKFSQRVRCTLDDIVENVQAFRNNFQNGSWIAYQETLKPQNNQWGVQLLVQDEFLKQLGKQAEAKRYEASVGGGFLGQKRCNQWSSSDTYWYPFVTDDVINTILRLCDVSENGQIVTCSGREEYLFESPDGFKYTGKNDRPGQSGFKCTQPETITPGRTVGEAVAKAVGSDLDFIMGADDLTQYVAAMVDAVINRLTKEATKGLSGIFVFDDTGKNIDRSNAYGGGGGGDFLASTQQGLLDLVEAANTTLGLVEDPLTIASSINNNLISTLNNLVTCQINLPEPVDPNASITLIEAETRTDTIEDMSDEIVSYGDRLGTLPGDIEATEDISALSDLSAEMGVLIPTIDGLFGRATSIQNTVEALFTQADTNLQLCEGG